jgi:hypothetical protein
MYVTSSHITNFHVSSALAVGSCGTQSLTKKATDSGMGTETHHLKQPWWCVPEQKGCVHEFHTSVKGTNYAEHKRNNTVVV